MKKIGVYIHIPFCIKKCFYCDFLSFPDKQDLQERYIKCLLKEIENFFWNNKEKDLQIKTIYIGGGTPSSINVNYIKNIMEILSKKHLEEATIEVNPGTVDLEKIKTYKDIGINRLSIGLQETDNNLLKQIGRIHTYEDFLDVYNMAIKVGFNNINVDLMIGLPNQKIQNIKNSLEKVVNLEPKHISVYSLIVEENTKLEKMIEQGILKLPDEELERQMYRYVKNFLELKGYNHYEISNFCKEKYHSKHNLDCWNQEEYIGFGLGAHSYIDNIRFSNTENLDEYINNIENEEYDKNKIIQEKQNEFSKKQEYMILGLRKINGISIKKFKNKFGENPIFIFRNELNKLVEENLLEINSDYIKLTEKGLDLANLVWEEFI